MEKRAHTPLWPEFICPLFPANADFRQCCRNPGNKRNWKIHSKKILAQVIKPNLGDYEKEGNFANLISKFRGTEAQSFFERISSGKIKISYKPQQVELIPKTAKGKVRDLLKKVDEKSILNEIVEKLEIKEILNNDIDKISGGELQRVAIAAAVLKKASLYIFDEPT